MSLGFRHNVLSIIRKGAFDVATSGDNHCSTINTDKTGQLVTVEYNIRFDCNHKTDSRGFIVDHLTIDAVMQSIKKTKLSCEELARFALDKVKTALEAENPSCQILRATVELSPEPFHVKMVSTWLNPDITAEEIQRLSLTV